MNKELGFCEKVSNCIELINTAYPEYKKEIIKATTLDNLSTKCKNFILNHQNKKQNQKEIDNYIKSKLEKLSGKNFNRKSNK